MKLPRCLKLKEVCEILQISDATSRRLIKKGILRPLPGVSKYRFAPETIEGLLKGKPI
jgi:predicted site-specific integrase-resolvase